MIAAACQADRRRSRRRRCCSARSSGAITPRADPRASSSCSGVARAFELTDAADAAAGPRAAAAAAARGRGARRPRNQSATIAGPALGGFLYAVSPVAGLCAVLRALRLAAGVLIALIRIERAHAARASRSALRVLVRRLHLHPPQPDHPRRDLARPVRGAARRRDRAAAGVRARRVRSRPLGARPVARRARGRRADRWRSC